MRLACTVSVIAIDAADRSALSVFWQMTAASDVECLAIMTKIRATVDAWLQEHANAAASSLVVPDTGLVVPR